MLNQLEKIIFSQNENYIEEIYRIYFYLIEVKEILLRQYNHHYFDQFVQIHELNDGVHLDLIIE